MQTLPLSLRHQMAQEIHKDIALNFSFFKKIENEKSFLSWIGHRLLPRMINKNSYLY